MKKIILSCCICLMFMGILTITAGAENEKPCVAIIDFKAKDMAEGFKDNVADLTTAYLTALYPDITLVERAELKKILEEQELNLSGLVSPEQAVKIGKLTGAKIIVTGNIFTLDRNVMVVAKIIGTETSKVKAVMVKGTVKDNIDDLIQQLTKKLGDTISKDANEFVAKEEKVEDVIKKLKESLKNMEMPKVYILIPENHIGTPIPDPAAKTELAAIMKEVGITILEGDGEDLAEWAKKYVENRSIGLPKQLKEGDVLIIGQAFSEFATRKGNLISCKARVELEAIDISSTEIIAIGSKSGNAVDLAERIAAKQAIQNVTSKLAVTFILDFVKSYNEQLKKKAARDQKKDKK